MDLILYQKTNVTYDQFMVIKRHCRGIVAFRVEKDKYYIKLMLNKYREYVLSTLKAYNLLK